MIKLGHLLLLLMSSFLIAACGESGHGDLQEFINNSGKGLRGKVDPLPEVRPYKFFTYEAFDLPNPFVPRKKELAKSNNTGLQPDLNRRKEILENFPLESLDMVGSIQKNKAIFALVRSPEGTLHRVRIGNYMGQDYGKIRRVSESEVELREIVQDGADEWTERISVLMLED